MTTDTVGSATSASGTLTQGSGLSGMKSEDFFRLLVTEMQQQDPLEPSKTSDMIGQVSQIRSIELSNSLTTALDAMVTQQRAFGTSELIGKYIQADTINADGEPLTVDGVVTAARFNPDGQAVLELDNGLAVAARDVVLVAASAPVAPPAESGDGAAAAEGGGDAPAAKAVQAASGRDVAATAKQSPLQALLSVLR